MQKNIKHPLFLIGLALRLVMLILVIPKAAQDWYVPFLQVSIQHFSFNPWKIFIASGGIDIAFPYGYMMWLVFLPLMWLSHAINVPYYLGYGLTLLVADFFLLLMLKILFKPSERFLLITYWLSPIVLFSTYWLGLNDLIPVTILCVALYFIRQLKMLSAGMCCGLAISAKLSMLLAIPFFFIYLFRNKGLKNLLPTYFLGLGLAFVFFGIPFILSQDGLHMLTHNPEMSKVYQLTLIIGDHVSIYLLPMIYLLMLYLVWYMRRINFELLTTLLGLSFFLVVLLTPASPGWFIWIMPLLVLYQAREGRMASILVIGFTILYVMLGLLTTPSPLINSSDYVGHMITALHSWNITKPINFLHTVLFAFGIILLLRIWHKMVWSNEYFRLTRKPFVIGIAGDSGSGKDTLVSSLQALIGAHSVMTLSGDDYHFWDRQKPIWHALTHLNPRANDLERFAQDMLSLVDRKPIYLKHYNHETGKIMLPQKVESNDFIISSGLHALYLPILRNCYDLSIYLDIDEKLRRYLKLKRDVHDRGHKRETVLFSLERREADAKKFIRPQASYADLIFSLQPIHPHMLENKGENAALPLKLLVRSKRHLNEESLLRVLISICGLHVDMDVNLNNEVELTIEGETSADDIALAAQTLFARTHEFLDIIPRWQDGMRGLIQLIVLSHINQSLSERLI